MARGVGVELTGVDSEATLAAMREVGYDHVIDYRRQDFTALGKRYDLILDTRTNRFPLRYLRALEPGGRYVTVGGDTRRLIQMFLLRPFVRRWTEKDIGAALARSHRLQSSPGQLASCSGTQTRPPRGRASPSESAP